MYAELSPDGKTLATVSNRQTLKLWDTDNGKERFSAAPANAGGFLGLLLISPDGRWVTAWDGRGPIEVRDMTGKVQARLDAGPNQAFYSYGAFSPDSKMLAVCTGDRVRFWQIPEGKEPAQLAQMIRTPGLTYTSAQFTPDGKTLLTGANRNFERIDQVWDLDAAKQKGTLKGFDPKVGLGRLRLSPDGRLALISTNRTAEVLDWAADRRVRLLSASGPDFAQVIFTPDSRHLLSLNGDRLVERWEIDSGKRVGSFKSRSAARGGPSTLTISRDSKTLVTAAAGEATFWDIDEAFGAAPGQ
jgi:WD40 repeat protein